MQKYKWMKPFDFVKEPILLWVYLVSIVSTLGTPNLTFGALTKVQSKAGECAHVVAPVQIENRTYRGLEKAFLGEPIEVNSEIGPLKVGIVNVDFPGVAESISDLLVKSISDARQTNATPGHLPDHLVDDVINQYISPEKVKTFWRYHGHRFAVMNSDGEIIGTIHLSIDKDTILYLNRWTNNVHASEQPGKKPDGYHQMMNLSVRHELRRARIASLMLDTITRHFRHLFNGKGIWMKADPPWHNKLVGLGFKHDPSMDSFSSREAEQTLGLPHSEYNSKYLCNCSSEHRQNPEALAKREEMVKTQKLKYFSFTRDFESRPVVRPKIGGPIDVVIVGGGIAGTSFALKLKELNPKLKTLVVSKDSQFALSGQGHLYPMTQMENFRFPGKDSIQPTPVKGNYYPGEVERALIANQAKVDILFGDEVVSVNKDGSLNLKSGEVIHARKVVVASGMTGKSPDFIDASARNKVEDFVSFSRNLSQIPYTNPPTGSFGSVAIIGDGAAGKALFRKAREVGSSAIKEVLLIGPNESQQKVTNVRHRDGMFEISVQKQDGQTREIVVDRVVTSLGFNNSQSLGLAAKLHADLIIGSGAFDGAAPPMVHQIAILNKQAEALNAELLQTGSE